MSVFAFLIIIIIIVVIVIHNTKNFWIYDYDIDQDQIFTFYKTNKRTGKRKKVSREEYYEKVSENRITEHNYYIWLAGK